MIRRRSLLAVALSALACVLAAAPAHAATSLYPDLKTLTPSELRSEPGVVNGETRWLLQFSNWVWNAGEGALEIRGASGGGSTVYQRVYDDAGGYSDLTVATDLTYHPTHDHFHLGRFAEYELWTKADFDAWVSSGRSVGTAKHVGTKASFCLLDSGLIQRLPGSPTSPVYRLCDQEVQGISVGYGDYYKWDLAEQWVDVGASPLPDGSYVLRSVADPDNKLYESANRSDSTRESVQGNEALTEFTVTAPVISRVSASASESGEATVSWTTDEPSTSRVDYGIDPATLDRRVSDVTLVTAHSVRLTGLTPGATYHFRVTSVDEGGIGAAVSPAPSEAPASFTVPGGPGCPCSLWSSSTMPATAANTSDGNAVELGVKFIPEMDGTITALRFYKGSTNTGTHVGSLWSTDGTKLASVTFADETASGWQQANLSTPVAVSAGTTYVASYHAPNGNYAFDGQYFATAWVAGALRAPSSDASGGNGVYRYGPSGFPTNTHNAANYWVDVVFATASGADTTAPTVTSVSPSDGATDVAVSVTPTATFSEAMDAATITTSTVSLSGPSGTVAASVSYDSAARRAALTPAASLDASTTYTMTVKGGTGGVADLAGNRLAADRAWSFTTAASPPPADTAAPVISAASASASASGEATVSWTTDEPSTSRVDYGTDPGTLGRNASDATLVTSHSLLLTGLTPGATYHYRVTSADAAGNSATSPATSEAPASFTVPAPAGVAFPSDVVVELGGLRSGSVQNLAAEDSAYLRVGSSREAAGRVTSWYGRMTGVPASPASLNVTYTGFNSRSCQQVLAIYRWTTSTWVQLDARTVGDSDVRIAGLSPPGTPADYVGAGGEVRVRVRCTTSANFQAHANFMQVAYGT